MLAAVATVSFADLAKTMAAIRRSSRMPIEKLMATLELFMDYGRECPDRYRLLFNNPETSAAGSELKIKAFETFDHFGLIVRECQQATVLDMLLADRTGVAVSAAVGTMALPDLLLRRRDPSSRNKRMGIHAWRRAACE